MPDKDNSVLGEDMIIDSESAVTLQDLEEMFDAELVKREEQKRAERMLMSRVNAERIKEETKVIREKAEELGDNIGKAIGSFERTVEKARRDLGLDRNVLESDAGDAHKKLHYECETGIDELHNAAMRKSNEVSQNYIKDVFAKLVLHDIIEKERSLRPEVVDGKQVAGPVERALNQPGAVKQFLEGIKNSQSFKDYFGPNIGPESIEKAFRENAPAKISRNLLNESKVFDTERKQNERSAARLFEEEIKTPQKEREARVLGSSFLQMQ